MIQEKINIAELLKDCPKGMELDCTMYDDIRFDGINDSGLFPITIIRPDTCKMSLTEYGQYADADYAKCIIFPKGKTTWEGFHRPFKDGDIVFTTLGNIAIIRKPIEGELFYVYGIMAGNYFYKDETTKVVVERLATEEEKQKLFDAIKANGYKWNTETKILEKLIELRFKVGDRIKHKTHIKQENIVTKIKDTYYILDNKSVLSFIFQDEYELVLNKFDITTFKPFESKVLVRDKDNCLWKPAIFGCNYIGISYPIMVIGGNVYRQCIPYENNEHLLGTTNNCNEFYKTWE